MPCDLKVTGSSCGIGHWKQVRPPTIHPSGCGPSPDPTYAGCFVHRAVLFYGAPDKMNVLVYIATIFDPRYKLVGLEVSL